MSSQPAPAQPSPLAAAPSRANPTRYFYVVAGIIMLVLSVVGFHHFYLQGKSYPGRDITPPIRGLIIAHAVLMSAWLLVFILQPLLIVGRRTRVHMRVGQVSAVMAVAIVVLGLMTATYSARVTPPDVTFGPLTAKQFMAVPYTGIILFAVFVAIGVWKRNRPDIHRPMMLLATLSALAAALDRIDALRELYVSTFLYTLWGSFFTTLVLGGLLLAAKCALSRRFDRPFAIGLAAMTVVTCVMIQLAPTAVWNSFASLFVP